MEAIEVQYEVRNAIGELVYLIDDTAELSKAEKLEAIEYALTMLRELKTQTIGPKGR